MIFERTYDYNTGKHDVEQISVSMYATYQGYNLDNENDIIYVGF